eukprot:882375_1
MTQGMDSQIWLLEKYNIASGEEKHIPNYEHNKQQNIFLFHVRSGRLEHHVRSGRLSASRSFGQAECIELCEFRQQFQHARAVKRWRALALHGVAFQVDCAERGVR